MKFNPSSSLTSKFKSTDIVFKFFSFILMLSIIPTALSSCNIDHDTAKVPVVSDVDKAEQNTIAPTDSEKSTPPTGNEEASQPTNKDEAQEDNDNETPPPQSQKPIYVRYANTLNFESATEGLQFYFPYSDGYVNYNIVHTVHSGINADVWRLGQAFFCDSNFENVYPLTLQGAEWDMAIKLTGRSDFIGGAAHGDEKYTEISLFIDGEYVDIPSITELTQFDNIVITEESVGYDPNDSRTEALNHYKEYIVDKNGITLTQKVEWLNDYTIGSSYMAMMPPLKELTDTFYTNIDYTPNSIRYGYIANATEVVVYNSVSGLSYKMKIDEYPNLIGGDRFLMTDNGGGSYNKMYFVICNGAEVSSGDIWETITQYEISFPD